MMTFQATNQIKLPDALHEAWQKTVDLLAEIVDVPAALIMRVHSGEIEVFLSSQSLGNVYEQSEKANLNTGLYCETVMKTRMELFVANALIEPEWDHNPDIKLGMISYCGLPITWPTGEIFGTICILDIKENHFSQLYRNLLEQFRDTIQAGLAVAYDNYFLMHTQEELQKVNESLDQRIAEREFAEASLRKSEARLLHILDNSPFGVSITSLKSKRRLYVNHRFTQLFGGGLKDDLRATAIIDSYVDPKILEENWTIYERDGAIAGTEELRKRLDGTVWWCLADWRPITFGEERAVMVWHSDITERKQAEEELKEKTELVNLLRKTASDANQATNYDAALHSCLTSVADHTGWPVGHVYLLSDDDDNLLVSSGIWHLSDPKRFATFVEVTSKTTFERGVGLPGRVLKSGEPAWIVDVSKDRNFPRAKMVRDIGVHGAFAFPVHANGKVVAVLEFFDEKAADPDETILSTIVHIGSQLGRVFERKMAEIELRKVMEEIDAANRHLERKVQTRTHELNAAKDEAEVARQGAEVANMTKTEFLANMSHELRTPLNAIIGFSEIIKGAMFGPLKEQYQDYAKDINDSGAHLLGIISDILDLSKVEAGELDIDEEDVDVVETAAFCHTMLGGRAKEAGITLTFDLATDLPTLHADPLRLKQILLNLIDNAIKFTPEGGLVTVSGETNGTGGVTFVVRDTGIGIAENDIPKVLEKFGQVRDGHIHAHEGSGLGLALAKSLMERHGGTLWIESAVGKGTAVTARFPPERTMKSPGHGAVKG